MTSSKLRFPLSCHNVKVSVSIQSVHDYIDTNFDSGVSFTCYFHYVGNLSPVDLKAFDIKRHVDNLHKDLNIGLHTREKFQWIPCVRNKIQYIKTTIEGWRLGRCE